MRLFSLDSKVYVYADVRDIVEYEYDEKAVERLALPEKLLNVLQQVFQAPPELLMSDIVKGKHGGLVVLASGKTGVGKTLTAEVYAEFTRRPLYKLGLGELGTTVEKVEKNLQIIFERVAIGTRFCSSTKLMCFYESGRKIWSVPPLSVRSCV